MDKELFLSVYGALLILGGAMGFAKKKSIPSLVAGAGSGALVVFLTQNGLEKNRLALQIITGLLFAGMGYRALKSGKLMPPGLVAILSGLALGAVSS